ncbi:MAG: hypothetical protein H8E03_01325 [Pelagibacteraceae bacterium]|nr:hypothetical protein [Pelagibacteraceae bacterium]
MALSELKSKLNNPLHGKYTVGPSTSPKIIKQTFPFEKTSGMRTSPVNFFDKIRKVNDGFTKNIKLGETSYKTISDNNFTWPLDLKRIDNLGNALSPVNDFTRHYSTSIGGISSQLAYPDSKLQNKFLHSNDIKFSYKGRYEFKTESQIRLDSNSDRVLGGHPLILKSLMDVNRYGFAKNRFSNVRHNTDFVRGGIATYLGSALEDQVRLGKFLLSGNGIRWMGKQFVLQYLNPRKETQLYNPLHINTSIIPFANVSRFINLRGSGVAEVMGFAKGGKGLYERTDGYDQWASADGRGEKNKLATYTRDRFDPGSESEGLKEMLAVKATAAAEKALKKGIFGKLGDGINELAGKFRAESRPANIINSQEHLTGEPISEETRGARKNTNYKTLPYSDLAEKDTHGFTKSYGSVRKTPKELQTLKNGVLNSDFDNDTIARVNGSDKSRLNGYNKIRALGDQSSPAPVINSDALGVIKKGLDNYDKINRHPYGDEESPDIDLVKFQFKDVVNKKYIVFRAGVTGLSESVSPEWNSEKYVGRADSVHIYKGAQRIINFAFTVAPKSKPELIILWEKLNYLTGLTFPDYSKDNRMVGPWVEFTYGNMYNSVSGYIDSLSYTIPDGTPYEIDEYQLPKIVEVNMSFKYVGNKLQTKQGKHFDLPWLVQDSTTDSTLEDGNGKINVTNAKLLSVLTDLGIEGHS